MNPGRNMRERGCSARPRSLWPRAAAAARRGGNGRARLQRRSAAVGRGCGYDARRVGRLVRWWSATSGLDEPAGPAGDAPGVRPAGDGRRVPAEGGGEGAHAGLKLQVDVVSIVKAPISDFKNVDLTGAQKSDTPYYVKLQIKALGAAPPKSDDDPAITFHRD